MAESQFSEVFKKKPKYDLNGAIIWHKVILVNAIKDAEKILKAEEEMLQDYPLTPTQ
jgi:hypothetical protein